MSKDKQAAAASIVVLKAAVEAAIEQPGAEAALAARMEALIEAVLVWAGENEGVPRDPEDAALMKAVWTFEGDQSGLCPDCDGNCGEPCAPCTVAQAHGQLDTFIRQWNRRYAGFNA